ncbi:MAG: hypothetical protein ABI459_05895 [Deltaproteobacteria bacterium]
MKILITLFALTASPALAFGDCNDPAYLSRFPEAAGAASLTCVELFRLPLETASGTRQIRAIMDISGDWAIAPDVQAEIERGARLAAALLPTLGRFESDDITLLAYDGLHGLETANIEGKTLTILADDECLISLYGLSSGGTTENMAVLVAHELFHCVQGETWPAQYDTYGSGGDWWVEGTAETFAALAIPDSQSLTDRAPDFDASVAANIALNDMQHEAAVFFYWLTTTQGATAMFPFIEQMAVTNGASAQHAAMRAALSPEQWLDFAKTYADGLIRHPQGGSVPTIAPDGQMIDVLADGNHTIPLAPFTLALGRVSYDCGLWGNTLSPAVNLALRLDENVDSWRDWPNEIDARDATDTNWRFAALPVDDSGAATLEVERRATCEPCQAITTLDRCLVGRWQVTSGGAIEWMRAQGVTARMEYTEPRIIDFRAAGVYATEPFGAKVEHRDGDFFVHGDGTLTEAFGTWSSGDGTLHICQQTGGLRASVTAESSEVRKTKRLDRPGGGDLSMIYSCEGDTLSTSLPIRGLPPMITGYSKMAE